MNINEPSLCSVSGGKPYPGIWLHLYQQWLTLYALYDLIFIVFSSISNCFVIFMCSLAPLLSWSGNVEHTLQRRKQIPKAKKQAFEKMKGKKNNYHGRLINGWLSMNEPLYHKHSAMIIKRSHKMSEGFQVWKVTNILSGSHSLTKCRYRAEKQTYGNKKRNHQKITVVTSKLVTCIYVSWVWKLHQPAPDSCVH